ncbi:5166_t:CDS:2, partial [Gigaspora margarita]
MDLQNKKADITYAQLFQVAPNIRKEINKITRAGRITIMKVAEFCLKQDKEEKTTSMYCEAQVKGHSILLILDSGTSECVVAANFLKELDIPIDCLSIVVMVRVHGEQKCPLGEVDGFSIMVGGKTITSRAVVTDTENSVIVSNNWMKKACARLDWEECELMIRDGKKKLRIPTKKEESEGELDILEEETVTETDESDSSEEYENENLGQEYETIYLNKEKKEEDFKLECMTSKQETRLRAILMKYKKDGPPIKQKFHPISKPEHEFIKAEIQHIEKADI